MKDPTSGLIASKISQLQNDSQESQEQESAIAADIKQGHDMLCEIIDGKTSINHKLELMHTKYMELFGNLKRLERDYAKLKSKSDIINKEKEALKQDLTKSNNQKKKLEDLARELSRENKKVKEDGKALAAAEEQKRSMLSAKFELKITQVMAKMEEEQHDKKIRQRDAQELAEKFKHFLEQYGIFRFQSPELREKHFNSIIKARDLEKQVLETRLEQQKQTLDNETANVSLSLIIQAASLRKQVQESEVNEAKIQEQLSSYIEKFKQVEETLHKSNDLFLSFRREMDDKARQMKKLEKENSALKVKYDHLNANILKMAEEHSLTQRSLAVEKKTRVKLEGLCRALQQERKRLDEKILELECDDYSEEEEEYTSEDEEVTEQVEMVIQQQEEKIAVN